MKKRKRLYFYAYCGIVLLLVVIKFQGNIYSIADTIDNIEMSRQLGCWNYNLIPFATLTSEVIEENYIILCANVMVFVPLGFLLPWAFQKLNNFRKVLGCMFLFILCCEFLQFIFKLGFFDIDDIILNLIGGCIGYILYVLIKNRKKVATE